VFCAAFGLVTDCTFIGNSAEFNGGGAYGGTLYNCALSGNSAGYGGGAARAATLYDCTLTGNLASSGGGASRCTLYNCTVKSNTAQGNGGGVSGGTLQDCVVEGNSAYWGGGASRAADGWPAPSFECTLVNCTVTGNKAEWEGGGAKDVTLINCTVTGNTVAYYGGGAYGGALYNCTLSGNSAGSGGGADGATLYNCTLIGNSADWLGGGIDNGTLYNCLVYFNHAQPGANWHSSTFESSCTTPLPEGPANIDADPRFVNAAGGDFRLRYGSPCIDAGALEASTASDLAGLPRPLDGNGDGTALPDMGAYEFDLRTVVSADWFTDHGLDANDPYVLSLNPDQDGQTSFQEWLAGTDPRDQQSFFRIEAVETGPPVRVSYQSLAGRVYTLYAAPDLAGGVAGSTLWTPEPGRIAVPGTGGLDSLTDTESAHRKFYRLGIDLP